MRMHALLVAVLALSLASHAALAKELGVEKMLSNSSVSVGDSVTVILKFTNPYGEPVPIQIQDKNVLGGNGLDVQCLEYTVPGDAASGISYTPIQVYQAGDYTLGPASVTYTDPGTGNDVQVSSNPLDVTVKGSQSQPQNAQQGITTIYRCGGMSMQSTSYSSSGSSTSIQISQGSSGQQPQQQPQDQGPGNVQQGNQDMSAIKQQMQDQVNQQEQEREELQKRIEQDAAFSAMQQQLQQSGYQAASRSVDPQSNDTGSFQYAYNDSQGKSAVIKGDMLNGTMADLQKWGDDDSERLAELLENTTEFRQLNASMTAEGFNLSSKSFSIPSDNVSSFDYSYSDGQGGQASIVGNITVQGELKDIRAEGLDEGSPWGFAVWLLVAAALLAAVLVYRRYFMKKAAPAEMVAHAVGKPFDFRKEAVRMIESARELFDSGRRKDAYARVSEGVRLYYKHALHSGKEELTSTDVLKMLKRGKEKTIFSDAKRCFELCDLVEFAKYAPNEKDFGQILEKARKLLGIG